MAGLLTLDMLPSTIALRPASGDTIAGAPSDAWALLGDGSTDIHINAPGLPVEFAISSDHIAKAFFLDGANDTLSLKIPTTFFVPVSGITPVDPENLATKDYVDNNSGSGLFVLKTGDTMTGQLEGITPVLAADMTRKDYVDLRQLESEKGQNNGYCPLNSSGLVPASFLAISNITFQGGWDASGNTLPIGPAGGDLYIITVAGTLTIVPADGSSSVPVPTPVVPGDEILFASGDGFWYQIVPDFPTLDLRYVQLTGSTMTGQLVGITPVDVGDLTRKDYVDNGLVIVNNNANVRVLRAGDTMTGQLEGITPVDPPDLTRKDYVDGLIAGIGGSVLDRVLKTGDTMTGQLVLPGGGSGLDAATIDDLASVAAFLADKVNKAGDTMTGQLVLPGGGTNLDAAQVVQISDAINVHVANPDPHVGYQLRSEEGLPNGYCPLNLSGLVPVALLPFTNVEFLGGWDAAPGLLPPNPASGGGFYIITVSGTLSVVPADGSSPTPVPTVVNVSDEIIFSSVDGFWYQIIPDFPTLDVRYVQLTGSTMTGQLVGITPVSAGDMTRKDYVDSGVGTRILRTGDTMSGQLSGITPSASENLTRKDYVDSGDTASNNNANSRVARTGDTMTGQLNGITPTAAANLARKDYVDLNKLNTDFLRTGDRLDIINVPVP